MHFIRRLIRPLVLSRPAIGLARLVAPHADIAIETDYRSTPAQDTTGRVARTRELMQHSLIRATPDEKQQVEAWFDDWAQSDQHTIDYAEKIFDGHRRLIEKHRGSLQDLRILELGPGHTLGPGLLLHANGARSYTAVDLFPLAAKESSLYQRLRRRISDRPILLPVADLAEMRKEALRRYDAAVDTKAEEARFDPTKVDWRCPVDAASLPFPRDNFDVVISNAAFEHFLDPVAAVRECARVTAPGGVGIHQIDFRDHRERSDVLDFLAYEDEEWKRLNADMVCYTNRFRKHDFEETFTSLGFSLELVEPNLRRALPPGIREKLHPRFQERPAEDLEVLSALFVVRKPVPAHAPG